MARSRDWSWTTSGCITKGKRCAKTSFIRCEKTILGRYPLIYYYVGFKNCHRKDCIWDELHVCTYLGLVSCRHWWNLNVRLYWINWVKISDF
jgi:hypothetical protein